ncbi:glycosyltransferase [Brevibacillus sp. AY1]|uniref:glycosyltransferase family protein n=1 Tax=Brevibacillus sp. AY1 TaxID=2807621 RepID=UPI002455F6C0|nr:glycosyltransferase [Brevibacillus sp. AY1]MDH4617007.1 glycosyltransferase [Brevibacillus sp. AY1]
MRVLFFENSHASVHGLAYGFRDAGHQVMITGPLTEKNIPEMIKKYRPELMVVIGWGPELSITLQHVIRQCSQEAKVPLVYWAVDDPTFLEIWSLPLISRLQVDFVFSVSPACVASYRQAGFRASHMDFGYDQTFFFPEPTPSEPRQSIALVGHAFPHMYKHHSDQDRLMALHTLIRPLLYENIRIDFYGRDWDKMKPFFGLDIPQEWIHASLPSTEMKQVYCSSDIVISLLTWGTQIPQKIFEILGCGGFLLTQDTPEIRRLFRPGDDLLVSATAEETLRLVREYLASPEERRRIRERGNLAVRNHTYRQRAEYMLRTLREHGILPDQKESPQHHGELLYYDAASIEPYETHIVSQGETLWEIAQRYMVSVEQLKKGNKLTSNMIFVGQPLKIPPAREDSFDGQQEVKVMLDKAARLFHLDPILLHGIAYAESSFGKNAGFSKAGAFGIMQLLTETAEELGIDRTNPWQNILGGAMYVKEMLKEFEGDIPKALGAYNWGVNNMKKAIAEQGNSWLSATPEETQQYVAKIMKYMDEAGECR